MAARRLTLVPPLRDESFAEGATRGDSVARREQLVADARARHPASADGGRILWWWRRAEPRDSA
jgi:hypothetical protein